MRRIPCDLSSTISTGSFLTSETLDVSPVETGLSSDSTEDQILKESASHPWNSLLPSTLQQRQQKLLGASETQLPEGEMHCYKGSQIQQILGKCTGDLNLTYSEDNTRFQALAAELDFPETDRHFPNFHHHLFQPLEPSLDFDTSSSSSQYRISQDGEFSKTSKVSTKSQDMSTFLELGNSGLNIKSSSLPSTLETNRPNSVTSEEESVKENVT
ncbi:CE295 protein, partial [Scopus umbretta]|nr:CE295 protein [Scopus umbretta]